MNNILSNNLKNKEEKFLTLCEKINKKNKQINSNFKDLNNINYINKLIEYDKNIKDIKNLLIKCNYYNNIMENQCKKIELLYENINKKFIKLKSIHNIINLYKIKQKLDEREKDLNKREKYIKNKEKIFLSSIY